jgi:hypothetical protein
MIDRDLFPELRFCPCEREANERRWARTGGQAREAPESGLDQYEVRRDPG